MSQHEKIERTNTDNSFWNKQWQNMTIGFHMSSLHPMLSKHINLLLENREKVRFFFPLCGKVCNFLIHFNIIYLSNINLNKGIGYEMACIAWASST